MIRPDEGRAPLATFLAVVFAGSVALSLSVALTGGRESALVKLAPLAMLLPALGVLVARLAFGARVPELSWGHFPLRWLPITLLSFPALVHVVALPVTAWLEGRLPWVHWLKPAADGLFHPPAERGWGVLSLHGLIGRMALNAVVGLVIVSLLALFEEIGWRAWMLPRLVDWLGTRKGALASALIWAVWHVPYALSGIHSVEGVPTFALVLLAPLGHVGAGLFLAWLWLRTRSIVLVSLAHGSLNSWSQYFFKYMNAGGKHEVELLAVVNGALLAMGLFIIHRMKSRPLPEATA